jgi:chromosome segregation and condensation protein ScpB
MMRAWPKTLSERVKAVSTALAALKEPVTASELARRFARAKSAVVGEILETLCANVEPRTSNFEP